MKPRRLSRSFLDELLTGRLRPLLDRVHADRTLELELRHKYLNVYYRGGNLLRWSAKGGEFDVEYGRGQAVPLPPAQDIRAWIDAFPRLKLLIDLFPKNKTEREVQQHLVRANNFGAVARKTDFFVCDIEYAEGDARFDLVLAHWPAVGVIRKQAHGRRLVLGELKHGDGALKGASGLHDHVAKADAFLSDPDRVRAFKDEMVALFNQKLELGVIDCGKPLVSFSDEPPLYLLMCANHAPRSTILDDQLATLPAMEHAEVAMSGASHMGYGLYDVAISSVTPRQDLP